MSARHGSKIGSASQIAKNLQFAELEKDANLVLPAEVQAFIVTHENDENRWCQKFISYIVTFPELKDRVSIFDLSDPNASEQQQEDTTLLIESLGLTTVPAVRLVYYEDNVKYNIDRDGYSPGTVKGSNDRPDDDGNITLVLQSRAAWRWLSDTCKNYLDRNPFYAHQDNLKKIVFEIEESFSTPPGRQKHQPQKQRQDMSNGSGNGNRKADVKQRPSYPNTNYGKNVIQKKTNGDDPLPPINSSLEKKHQTHHRFEEKQYEDDIAEENDSNSYEDQRNREKDSAKERDNTFERNAPEMRFINGKRNERFSSPSEDEEDGVNDSIGGGYSSFEYDPRQVSEIKKSTREYLNPKQRLELYERERRSGKHSYNYQQDIETSREDLGNRGKKEWGPSDENDSRVSIPNQQSSDRGAFKTGRRERSNKVVEYNEDLVKKFISDKPSLREIETTRFG